VKGTFLCRWEAGKRMTEGGRIINLSSSTTAIHLILNGQITLTVRDAAGKIAEVARLSRGEFFGEKAVLSSEASDVTATAVDDAELLVLDTETLQPLIDRVPQLARELGGVMEARRKALRTVKAAVPQKLGPHQRAAEA